MCSVVFLCISFPLMARFLMPGVFYCTYRGRTGKETKYYLIRWHADQKEPVDASICTPRRLPSLPSEPATLTILLLRRVEPASSARIACCMAVRPCPAPNVSLFRQTHGPVGIYCLWSNPTWTNCRRITAAASTRFNRRSWRAGKLSRAS